MNLPLELLAALSLAGQQVTENLLGGWFPKGAQMRLASIAVTIGLTFAAKELGLEGLAGSTPGQVAILGVFAGLGANVTHALFSRYAPVTKDSPLTDIVKKLAQPNAPPPAAPTP